ncbi:MAG: D-alanyl-D-alanine carboxypeptidase [Lachnospiraceae bacterium]|nr:D-alanyl-D-alanine carboxypeptidase [Lachnospiraceae bacterium]
MHVLRRAGVFFCAVVILLVTQSQFTLEVFATQEELNQESEDRKKEPVQTNEIENWPQGPAIGAEGAILLEANTGALLYAKNIDEKLYPASITKLMCCLVAVENCALDEVITVNQSAIDANAADGSSMGLKAGEQLTLEELLYGILINSANEGCNVVAEHIAGSIDAYVDMMNARAAELGCTGTHFVTANGLYNEDHYTTAHDMALIGVAFFSHDNLCRIASTPRYTIPETATHGEHVLHSKNKLYVGGDYEYADLVGSKTGFTNASRQTLVSCAERGGMRLVAVILKEESPLQFADTVELFEYGFNNFSMIDPDEFETGYTISNSGFFNSGTDIFGSTAPLLATAPSAGVVLPGNLTFSDLSSSISYDDLSENAIAKIEYSYAGASLGSTDIVLNPETALSFNFQLKNADGSSVSENPSVTQEDGTVSAKTSVSDSDDNALETETPEEKEKIYINVYHVLFTILGIAGALIVLFIIYRLSRGYFRHRKRLARIKRERGKIIKDRNSLRRDFRRRNSHRSAKNTDKLILKRKSDEHPTRKHSRRRPPRRKPK